MKKVKLLLLLMLPLVLTGCSSTLKCQLKTNNYNSKYNAKVKITFKDDRPVMYKYKDEMIFNDVLSADSELYYHAEYANYSYLISNKYAKISNFSNKVGVKIEYNFLENNSLGEEELLVSRDSSFEEAKAKIENFGYVCK